MHWPKLSLLALLLCLPALATEVFVAPAGDDSHSGTRAQPFRTIGKAASVLQPGDTCWLRGGVYREMVRPANSGAAGKPIRFAAYAGETVTVSGADPLTGAWSRHRGDIWKITTDRRFIQFFSDGRMLPEARWPNTDGKDLMVFPRAACGPGTDKLVLADPKLPPGDWNGAVCLIWPGDRWTSAMRRVTEYQPGKSFKFSEDFVRDKADPYHQHDPYAPRPGNPYVLSGALAGVDSPGEWFLDQATGTLYLQVAPGDTPQKHRLAVKQRDFAFDLSKLANIEIRGIEITAAAVGMAGAQGCLVTDCRVRYPQHVREWTKQQGPPVLTLVSGQGNTWRRCLVAYAALAGLRLQGEGNRVENCIIHDTDYCGRGDGGLNAGNSAGATITHCTISRVGRDVLPHHGSKRITIEYNDLYHGNMLNNDAGGIYSWGTDGTGSTIAYNWVHDQLGDATCGIYLDNFCKGFTVHHNVVWNTTGSAIRLNSDAMNHLVANNTITQVSRSFGTFTYAAYKPTMQGTRVLNNLVNAPLRPSDPAAFVQGELGPELRHNGLSATNHDGVPQAGSPAVDAGVQIPGVTDGFRGEAPDLGAYEHGSAVWRAGAQGWSDAAAPAPPARDLAFTPRGPITDETMIHEGLLVWFDAADARTLEVGPEGQVTLWRSKAPARLPATPVDPRQPVKLVADALNGKPVVRGDGAGALRVAVENRGPEPLTVLVVSQGQTAGGPPWQRIAAASQATPQEWEAPNWILMRPGGAKPEVYPAQVFLAEPRPAGLLDRLTLLGASVNNGQNLCGDIAEVIIYGRALRFDELLSLQDYLNRKWGLK